MDECTQTLSTASTPWDGPLITVEFGVRRCLYDVIPERQKWDPKKTGTTDICPRRLVERLSYLPCPDTTVGCARRTHLSNIFRKEALKCPHMTHSHLPYPGHSPKNCVVELRSRPNWRRVSVLSCVLSLASLCRYSNTHPNPLQNPLARCMCRLINFIESMHRSPCVDLHLCWRDAEV